MIDNTSEEQSLLEEQLDATCNRDNACQSDFKTPGHRADFASATLVLINNAIRRTEAHHAADRPTLPDYPWPQDRLSNLYQARADVLALL